MADYNERIFFVRSETGMSNIMIPQDYHTPLSVYEMQRAIEFIKSNF